MIIYMSNIICITNRALCKEDFWNRITKIIKIQPHAIILREKDLEEAEYEKMAEKFLQCCTQNDTLGILHTYYKTAQKLGCKAVHVPLPILREMSAEERSFFTVLGTSCHAVEEAKEAESLGCSYIIAGHIYETDCKKGVRPRGLQFLSEVVHAVSCPVWAIGGITHERIKEVQIEGAAGGCMMSGLMTGKLE